MVLVPIAPIGQAPLAGQDVLAIGEVQQGQSQHAACWLLQPSSLDALVGEHCGVIDHVFEGGGGLWRRVLGRALLCKTAVTGASSFDLQRYPQHELKSTLNACAVRLVVSTTSLPLYASLTVAMPTLTCIRCVSATASKPGPEIKLNSNSLQVAEVPDRKFDSC